MRFIKLNENKKVIGIRHGKSIVYGEKQSNTGELGQIRQDDGTFINAPVDEVTPQPTLEDKVNFLYYKEKGLI